ncbi:MAG: hypothetical protein M1836_004986 [Candelina mexicana]|nr:MAG: hypothetical protein M1836_004986 [Candelina mexicana]
MPDNLLSRPDEVAFVPKDTVLAGRQGLPQLWQRVDFGNPEAESCIISLRFASHVEDVRDVDTWRNIRSVATQIIDQCIGIPATGAPRGKGGGESCGGYVRTPAKKLN